MTSELRKARDLLAELNDKHLSHCATVTRALVLKRIEALDALIEKPMDPKLAEAIGLLTEVQETTLIASPGLAAAVARFLNANPLGGTRDKAQP